MDRGMRISVTRNWSPRSTLTQRGVAMPPSRPSGRGNFSHRATITHMVHILPRLLEEITAYKPPALRQYSVRLAAWLRALGLPCIRHYGPRKMDQLPAALQLTL